MFDHYKMAEDRIDELIREGWSKFVLFPYGEQGRLARAILNTYYDITDLILVDNRICKTDSCVKSLDDLKDIDLTDYRIIFTSDREDIHDELIGLFHMTMSKEVDYVELYPGIVEKNREDYQKEYEKRKQKLNNHYTLRKSIWDKVLKEGLLDKGLVYKPININSKFFLPYIFFDLIQIGIFLSSDYYEAADLRKVFLQYKDGFLKNYVAGGVMIDVGANIGNHTLFFCNELSPKAVYSFEAVGDTFRILQRNIELNELNDKTEIFCMGLSDKDTNGEIANTYADNIGATSLREGNGNIIFKKIDDFDFENVRFIKIDVEGMELQVLKGARDTIIRERPYILMESFSDQFQQNSDYLRKLGYSWITIKENMNYLFIPKDNT